MPNDGGTDPDELAASRERILASFEEMKKSRKTGEPVAGSDQSGLHLTGGPNG